MLLFFKGKDVGFIAGWNIRGQVGHFHPELLSAQGLNPFDIARLFPADPIVVRVAGWVF